MNIVKKDEAVKSVLDGRNTSQIAATCRELKNIEKIC